jgi:plasmid replication initiation protein
MTDVPFHLGLIYFEQTNQLLAQMEKNFAEYCLNAQTRPNSENSKVYRIRASPLEMGKTISKFLAIKTPLKDL